jgi:hypothetical protein
MSGIVRVTAAAVLVLSPLTAWAHGGRRVAPVVTAYYYPAPVYYEPVYPVVLVPAPCPIPVATPIATASPSPIVVPYAAPTAAPPSTGPSAGAPARQAVPTPAAPSSPPAAPPGQSPAVKESSSFYDATVSRPREPDPALTDRIRAGFWNLSGREVTLKVEGRNYILAPQQNLRLDVSRRFVWREGDNKPQIEQVPTAYPSVEIVLRR